LTCISNPRILRRNIDGDAGVRLQMSRSDLSRRRVLASLGAAPVASMLVQTDTARASGARCEGEAQIAPRAEMVFSAMLRLNLATPADATVGSAIILGGEARGELAGEVRPGGLEWLRDPARGVLQLSCRFELQATAGLRIHVADRATVVTPTTGCWEAPFSTTPELTVVDGLSAACREAVYVGRMDARQLHAGRVSLIVHRVL
jgi:hypothetical protein